MSEAPERITAWVNRDGSTQFSGDKLFPSNVEVEYVRADLHPVVKPLEWRDSYGVLRAETPFGDYKITGKILRMPGTVSVEMVCENQEAGKDVAQADYEKRTLFALEPAPITPAQHAKGVLAALGGEYQPLNPYWIIAIDAAARLSPDDLKVRGSDAFLAMIRAIAEGESE
jgi:hypothetical protein